MSAYPVYLNTLEDLKYHKKILVNTLNQYSFCIAERDQKFKAALQQSDVLLPDGIGVVAAVKLLTGKTIKKIAGADIHKHLLEDLQEKSGSCFYLGSSENTLAKIRSRMAEEYPNVRVGTYSPPYKAEFTDEENQQMIEAVNAFSPDVLFIGMTAPKQEKWAHAQRDKLNTNVICSIGAVFDFYAGTVRRPARIWINFGLEWFGRLIKEPSRMWKRYLLYGPIFLWYIVERKFRVREL